MRAQQQLSSSVHKCESVLPKKPTVPCLFSRQTLRGAATGKLNRVNVPLESVRCQETAEKSFVEHTLRLSVKGWIRSFHKLKFKYSCGFAASVIKNLTWKPVRRKLLWRMNLPPRTHSSRKLKGYFFIVVDPLFRLLCSVIEQFYVFMAKLNFLCYRIWKHINNNWQPQANSAFHSKFDIVCWIKENILCVPGTELSYCQ